MDDNKEESKGVQEEQPSETPTASGSATLSENVPEPLTEETDQPLADKTEGGE